jgi:hypothetical protein
MEKNNQAENIGLSRQGLLDIEKKMIANGFIEKDKITSWTRTTEKWDEVYLKKEYDLQDVKKLDTVYKKKSCKESLHSDVKNLDTTCKESLHHTYNIYNNKNINNKDENFKFSKSLNFSDEEKKNNVIPEAEFLLKEKNCEKKEKTDDLNALNLKDEANYQKEITKPKKENKMAKKECSDFIQSQFEEFWDKYGIKEDRKKCEAKFKSLTNEAREKILLTVESFVKYQYIKNKGVNGFRHRSPARYLNEENWNDEILPLNQNGNIEFVKRNEKKENSYLDEIDEILKNK